MVLKPRHLQTAGLDSLFRPHGFKPPQTDSLDYTLNIAVREVVASLRRSL
jgi:hypothetical protein